MVRRNPSPSCRLGHVVRQIICAREARSRFFRPELFHDPAWDLLLELFRRSLEDDPVFARELIESAALPRVAARWIEILEDDGLIRRIQNRFGNDLIELSQKGVSAMLGVLSGWSSLELP